MNWTSPQLLELKSSGIGVIAEKVGASDETPLAVPAATKPTKSSRPNRRLRIIRIDRSDLPRIAHTLAELCVEEGIASTANAGDALAAATFVAVAVVVVTMCANGIGRTTFSRRRCGEELADIEIRGIVGQGRTRSQSNTKE